MDILTNTREVVRHWFNMDDECLIPIYSSDQRDEAIRKFYEGNNNIMIYSLNDIKAEYMSIDVPYLSSEEYLRNNFTAIYDMDFNFIGYERENIGYPLNNIDRIDA